MSWFQSTRRCAAGLGAAALAVALAATLSTRATTFGQISAQSPTPATGQSAAPNSSADILNHVNLVLRWSRQWQGADVTLSRPGDETYVENGRDLADQIVRMEFQSALAQAELLGASSAKPAGAGAGSSGTADTQNIQRAELRVEQQVTQFQAAVDAVNQKLAAARAKDKPALVSERDTLQGQLQLAQALQANLQKLLSFMSSADSQSGAASDLTNRILSLERTVPGAAVPGPGGKGGAKTVAAPAQHAAPAPVIPGSQSEGLIGQVGQMIRLMQSLRALDRLKTDAVHLQSATRELRAPLLTALRSTLQQGQIALTSAAQNAAASTVTDAATSPASAVAPPSPDSTATAQQKQQAMAALIAHFKLLSKATLPLSQQMILLDQSVANLNQLQASIKHDYLAILRTLLLKVATILIALGLIWLFSELWRRATFRYIRDARRRRQFLVLRRVVTGFCMFVVILLGFVSDFSSLATYAGLITAGVAVALQAVILSVAAYFFLVGRYGVKVGDRITVVYNGSNSVAGDVVDIGLVRFYMMELAANGVDMQPTGRICVFPNSVLFQTNPMFKQMPGTEYVWREIAIPVTADTDGAAAEKALLALVEQMYASYKPLLDREHSSIEDTLVVNVDTPRPHTRVRFAGSGLEVMVRYPIPLRQAAELDDRMVMEVTELLRKNPSIHLAGGSSPELRSPVKI